MTRQQAYKLADPENLFDKDQTNDEIIYKAMGIFAGAFAEWIDGSLDWSQTVNSQGVFWADSSLEQKITTAELIAIFEKID